MEQNDAREPILVIPCSGIGKVQGLISREVVYKVADQLLPRASGTMCLALLVTGDAEALAKVKRSPCVTVDGCPKLCARKNVELSGGNVALGVRVYDALKRHRGASFGSATTLDDAGWRVVDQIAAEIAAQIAATAERPAAAQEPQA